jgi:hypothetical protein
MPDWGSTDILNSKGKEDAAAQATAMSVGGRDPSTGGNTNAATGDTLYSPPVATGNPGNQYGNNPNPVDRWQGGASDPRGTQDPQTGRQTGGRYVDPTYQTDATGRVLTPEEQAAWRDYDRRRAEAASIWRSNHDLAKPADPNKGLATNAVYDPITQTYSMVDSDGVWTKGLTVADLQSKLSDTLKKQYPDWWWGQYASQQNQARRYEVDAGAFDAQKFATMGQQSTRYGPTNF